MAKKGEQLPQDVKDRMSKSNKAAWELRKGVVNKERFTFTPGPWNTGGLSFTSEGPRQSIWGPTPGEAQSGEWIAKDVRPANASRIVLCCNGFDIVKELIEVLRAVEFIDMGNVYPSCPWCGGSGSGIHEANCKRQDILLKSEALIKKEQSNG
jgi:hypothetical protein